MKRYFLLWLTFLGLYAARGQDGSLDLTFNGTGWAPLNFVKSGNANNDYGRQLLVQSDGKYIVLTESGYYMVLARYTPNGELDKTFGTDGFSYPIDLNYPYMTAVVQADDKIVVGGSKYNYNTETTDLALVRYTSNGARDIGFGSAGTATASFAPYSAEALSLSLQSTGEIIAVGSALDNNTGAYAFAVARFISTGALDNTFNSGGTLTLDFGTYYAITATAVALQSDGKIIVGGQGQDPTTGQGAFTLVRLLNDGTSDGTIDATFGTDGWARTPFASGAYLTSLAIQGDDKIVAGGYGYNSTTGSVDFALARYTSSGVLDIDNFNPEGAIPGTATTDLGSDDFTFALVLGSGQIVQVGSRETYVEGYFRHDIVLVRYTSSGLLDESFGDGGKVITTVEGDDEARAAIMLEGGHLLVAGSSFTTSSNTADVLLARYSNDGTLDNTFNATDATPGIALSYYSYGIQAVISDMVVQPDGKLVVAGSSAKDTYYSYYTVFGVARFNLDGTLDATFGNGGVAVADFGNSAGASSVALQPDGKIVLGGGVYTYTEAGDNNDFALARFTRDGVLDVTFSGDGMATADFFRSDALHDIVVQADGKIIGVGEAYYPYEPEGGYNTLNFALVRFNTNGTVDTRFGKAGLVTTDFFGYDDNAVGVAIQPDGKILVSGGVNHPDPGAPDTYRYEFAVARYYSNGILDPRFGTGGKATTTTGTAIGGAYLALQADGKMVVGGTVEVPGADPNYYESDFALVRFTSAGLLDNSFSADGLVTTDFGGQSEYAGPVALQSDGKILLAGWYYSYDEGTGLSTDYFAVARYLNEGTSDGALDASFDGDGKAAVSFAGANFGGAATWHNGRVYTTGYWRMPELAALAGTAELPPSFFESSIVAAIQASSATPPLPVVSIADASVDEGTAATLPITLSVPATVPVTVNYATQDGTAASKGRNSDYRFTRGSVTIAAGSSSATISIPTNLNGPGDDDQYFYVNLSLGVKMTGVAIIGDGQAKVTINEPVVTLAGKIPAEQEPGRFSATAYPNPSADGFTLTVQSPFTQPLDITVLDASGRVIESRSGVAPNGILYIGTTYRPGVYHVQVLQGDVRQTLRLIKQAH